MILVLCEGFRDRSFWHGLLPHFGWTPRGGPGSPASDDRWGKVPPGIFSFEKGANHLRVQPCGSDTNVWKRADDALRERNTRPVRVVLVNVDADTQATETTPVHLAFEARLRNLATRHNGRPDAGGWQIDDSGACRLWGSAWACADPPTPGVPPTQCLDRLVTAALAERYPERAKLVAEWVASSGSRHDKTPTWTWMAGWYPERECDYFFRGLWDDEEVKLLLLKRLETLGMSELVRRLDGLGV